MEDRVRNMEARLALNPLVNFYLFDQHEDNEQWVCELACEDGTFRYLLPKDVMDCLRQFDGVRTTDDVVASFSSAVKIEHCKMDLIMFFVSHGVLIGGGGDCAGGVEQPVLRGEMRQRTRYVQFRRRLFSGNLVARVSARLGWLFRLPLVLGGLAVAFAVHVHVYCSPIVFPTLVTLEPMSLLIVALTSALGTFCHEFGHAAALVRHGGRNPEIGVGVYIVFPVMHTDVSEAWRLSRNKRIQIDVSGIYFQLLFMTGFWLLAGVLGLPGRDAAIVWMDMLIAMALNPFLRMDGFWLLSDLLGSHSLRRESEGAIRTLWNNSRRDPLGALIGVLSDSRVMLMAVYYLASVGVFAILYFRVCELAFTEIVPGLCGRVVEVWVEIVHGRMAKGAGDALVVLWHGVLLVTAASVTLTACARLIRTVWRYVGP